MADSKRQKVIHLSQGEWLLLRPETYVGPIVPADVRIPVFDADAVAWNTVHISPAVVNLANELSTNALDNSFRDDTQRHISIHYRPETGTLAVSNDGSALPVEHAPDTSEWAISLAFGEFQSGSNFDDTEVRFTAGRNGVGAKGCNVFSTRFSVEVHDAHNKKSFAQTWTKNMSETTAPKIKATARKTNQTVVEWTPDYARLVGTPEPPECMADIAAWLAHNASLCAPAHVKVSLNGKAIKLRTCEHFCRALGGVGPMASEVLVPDGHPVLRVAVAARAEGTDATTATSLTMGFVNSTPCCEGSLAKYVLGKIADLVQAKASAKRDAAAKDVHVTPTFVRTHAIVVAVALVPNPRFTSQTKECLDTAAKDFGFKWEPSASFISAIERSPLVDRALQAARDRADAAAAKATKVTKAATRTIDKYEPALRLGAATLLVTEGDSAKNFAVAGLSVTGRKQFGVYPIRGKFLNVRGVGYKTIVENKEARDLLHILGLQLGTTYTAESRLPYARMLIMSDMDNDGSHIAGLLYNFVETCAPSLLKVHPNFVCRFATSLIRVTLPRESQPLGFFSQTEYDAWRADRVARGLSAGTAKFFKGLGTSTASMAKEYFRNLDENTIVLTYSGRPCAESLDLFFNKKRADDRKAFLTRCDTTTYVDYAKPTTTLERFVRDELLPQYAMASIQRAIPSVIDGFKVSTRKVFFGCRALKLANTNASAHGDMDKMTTTKVSIATGKISARTNYHHGDAALSDTLVGMAVDYAGASNVNLLLPAGSYGNRHNHEAAAPRYIETCLNDPVQALLFPPADDAVLEHIVDEGIEVEPKHYVPVIPTVLAFGARGIATGWSTDCPQYNPIHLIDACDMWISGRSLPPLTPWYRGFGGTVEREEEGTFVLRGACERRGEDVHVTEVPPVKETEAYEAEWRKVCASIEPGENKTDERVHTVLKKCTLPEGTDLTKALHLEKRVTLHNIHLLDAAGRLQKYAGPGEVLVQHAIARHDLYEVRIAHQISKCADEAALAEDRARYIEACLTGTFDMRAHADEAAASHALAQLGFAPRDGFDHLLKMPMSSTTAARASALRAQCVAKRDELDALQRLTPGEAWRSDLHILRDCLSKDVRYA